MVGLSKIVTVLVTVMAVLCLSGFAATAFAQSYGGKGIPSTSNIGANTGMGMGKGIPQTANVGANANVGLGKGMGKGGYGGGYGASDMGMDGGY